MSDSSTTQIDLNHSPVDTNYCVELWERDLQIVGNQAHIAGRVVPLPLTDEPIAVVCYGPSLHDTWEEIRNFKKIITCSGALQFLLDRGIVPTWHIEVDPRPHKAEMMREPHPDVEYLLASCVHKAVIDKLEQFGCKKIKLWNILSDEYRRPSQLYRFPFGEWMLTGGCNVGLRAMAMARFLGHHVQTVFGLDSSFTKDRVQHAGFHPKEFDHVMVVSTKYGEYITNAPMLKAARQFIHEIAQIPDLDLTLKGDGLIQTITREWIESGLPIITSRNATIAMTLDQLISPEYLQQNQQLHQTNAYYGTSGAKYASIVADLKEKMPASSVLDYGCGKGTLAKSLPFPIWEYDPAIPGKDSPPRAADLVVCTDVLEHIEPEKLDAVLNDLRGLTLKVAYLAIATVPAEKTLPDGRNTHLIVQDQEWWTERVGRFFEIHKTILAQEGRVVKFVAAPKKDIDAVPVKVETRNRSTVFQTGSQFRGVYAEAMQNLNERLERLEALLLKDRKDDQGT